MQRVLEALNQLVSDGVVEDYAIGGAIGASFYLDAMQTEDVDAFVFLPPTVSGIVLITPIYDALVAMGGVIEGEYVRFGDWPLQILSDANSLIAEAIREASVVDYDEIQTRVFRPEHLCAIALQTGRKKDTLRVTMFFEQGVVDMDALMGVLRRYELIDRAKQLMPGTFEGDR